MYPCGLQLCSACAYDERTASLQGPKDDPRHHACTKRLRALLNVLKRPLLPSSLFAALLTSISVPSQSDYATRLALRTFASSASLAFSTSSSAADASQGTAGEPHMAAAAVACRASEIAASSNAPEAPAAETRRAAALAVAAAAAATADAVTCAVTAAAAAGSKASAAAAAPDAAVAAAAAAAEALLPCLPHLATAAADVAAAVRVVALSAAGSVVAAAGSAAVEHVPAVCEITLKRAEVCLKSATTDTTETGELTAALDTLRALISTVPGLLFPYFQRTLSILHHPHTLTISDSTCTTVATRARQALTQHVEFRLLVPALQKNLPEAESHGTGALVATVNTLKDAVVLLPPAVAVAHVEKVAEVVLMALDVRGRAAMVTAPEATGVEASATVDAQAVEVATYQVRMHLNSPDVA